MSALCMRIGLALLITGISLTAFADDPTAKLKGWVDLIDEVTFTSNVSQDQQAATVLFRNLTSTAEHKDVPVNVEKLTVELGVDAKEETSFPIQIRGFVDMTGKSKVSLLVACNGKTTLVDMAKARDGKKYPPSETLKQLKAAAEKQFGPTQLDPESGNFQTTVQATIAKGGRLLITLVLITELEGESPATITVDSLDFDMSKKK